MNIEPNRALGPLALGQTLSELERVFGKSEDKFHRTSDTIETTYVFEGGSIHATVKNDVAIHFSLFSPALVKLHGVALLGRPLEDVSFELASNGVSLERIDVGLQCKGIGVTLVEIESLVDSVEVEATQS